MNAGHLLAVRVHPDALAQTQTALRELRLLVPEANLDEAASLLFALGVSHFNATPALLRPLVLKYMAGGIAATKEGETA